jgi:hypothetical protein
LGSYVNHNGSSSRRFFLITLLSFSNGIACVFPKVSRVLLRGRHHECLHFAETATSVIDIPVLALLTATGVVLQFAVGREKHLRDALVSAKPVGISALQADPVGKVGRKAAVWLGHATPSHQSEASRTGKTMITTVDLAVEHAHTCVETQRQFGRALGALPVS